MFDHFYAWLLVILRKGVTRVNWQKCTAGELQSNFKLVIEPSRPIGLIILPNILNILSGNKNYAATYLLLPPRLPHADITGVYVISILCNSF